jgi:hypothetical protein
VQFAYFRSIGRRGSMIPFNSAPLEGNRREEVRALASVRFTAETRCVAPRAFPDTFPTGDRSIGFSYYPPATPILFS